ncbi:MAG: VOC family protein [Thermoleophilia bacterium]|nr:VOC family protein [Thermoleophilia bacterium]
MAGRIVNFEIPADDLEGATEFWGGLFGWEFAPAFGGGPPYLVARTDGGGAAISGLRPGERGPVVYLDVDDIGDGTARVRELGGVAGDRMPVPGMGWFAVCADPHGNAFGLWQDDPSASMG